MNNNAEFYNKLFKRIVFIFCFLFILFINVLRFFQLQTEEKPISQTFPIKPSYLSFVLFQNQNRTHMIFIQDQINDTYLRTILNQIGSEISPSIALINCAENTFLSFKNVFTNKFPNHNILQESCDITSDRLQELYNQKNFIIVVLKNENLDHPNALHFAYQNKLKPQIKTVEIKHEI